MKGRGGNDAGGQQFGVEIDAGGKILGGSGAVALSGTGGASPGSSNDGVLLTGNGTTISAGAGGVSITGTAGTGGVGVDLANASSVTTTSAGAITVSADTMFFDTANPVTVSGANGVTLKPRTAGTTIDLGGTTNTLRLTNAELGLITAGSLTLGNSTTGNINVTSAISALVAGIRSPSSPAPISRKAPMARG